VDDTDPEVGYPEIERPERVSGGGGGVGIGGVIALLVVAGIFGYLTMYYVRDWRERVAAEGDREKMIEYYRKMKERERRREELYRKIPVDKVGRICF